MKNEHGSPVAVPRMALDFGSVLVDSGHLLIVDPCHLPPDLLQTLSTPNAYGYTPAVVVQTPMGDGLYEVQGRPGCLEVVDPYAEPGDEDPSGGWYPVDGRNLAKQWSS